MSAVILREFSNIGLRSASRHFAGFLPRDLPEHHSLATREAKPVALAPGDTLSIMPDGPAEPWLLAFDARGGAALCHLGLTEADPVPWSAFDAARLRAWIAAEGGDSQAPRALRFPLSAPAFLRAAAPCTLWLLLPCDPADAVAGQGPADLTFAVKRAAGRAPRLPPPLGPVREEFTVPRGTARAYAVEPGEIVQIIDLEGQQCSDFMAFRRDALDRGATRIIDSTATRSMVRHAYPGPGLLDKFYDRDMHPLLQVLQDTCGRHDTFGLACTARGYEDRGFPGHLNCSDNISGAIAPFGVAPRDAWPAINFFWNTWIDPQSHQLLTEESHSRPGDYVAMRALMGLVCVSTACPDDIDPINGWNPTDVHVRIYRPEAPIRRAVAHRVTEDAPMTISRESAFHARTSALTTQFAPARDLWMPTAYPATGTVGEYWACRERVTLQDMSALRKYDIIGPDAEALLQQALTRNIAKLASWRGTYALICDETGAVIDDGTLFRLGPDLFRWCCGSEESGRHLTALADAAGLTVRLHDMSNALVNLALQGPRARDVLQTVTFTQPHVPALAHMKWFGATTARLHDREGAPFLLTRTGYTGELGYELFCTDRDALAIWDALMAAGAAHGIAPMGSAALELLRVEAGLAAAGAEFGPGADAFEAGLGFAVDLSKAAFVGKDALTRNKAAQRRRLRGLVFHGPDLPSHGAPVYAGERQIGAITSAIRSPLQECSIAMARLAVEHCETGTGLEVGQMGGRLKRLPATVADIPFYDPARTRARA